jgi:ribonuclease E
MAKKMLIDAAHPEETRVVVVDGTRVDDFDFEIQNRKQLRGNIYLAKVTRVEPSLQAAFVEYGGNRHGFLAFGEIHPDYFQIPSADREALKAEVEAADRESEDEDGAEEDLEAAEERRRRTLMRRYKIQEVIKRRQIMLIQVVKEERGNKGAALTTYLSLAGRYCVLMPNSGRGGGISRKITNSADRKRLKKVANELDVQTGMGLIVRTAGAKRTKTEIKRDYEYLTRAWETIRDTTMRSVAPALIYEESSLVKRAIRDLYDKDVDDIYVQGDAAYKEAKDFVRMLMPSHAKKVQHYKETAPILTKFGVEKQLESIYSPVVTLRSGGYIVINQTEALVAIDVNSGRATREKNIEQTALKTNLEAADEAARQMRLRDLAGLIVIDFIDMEDQKNDRQVEKRMKDCLRFDRARVQMGKISGFGLLELSRQRRRTGILEGSSHICPMCQGTGRVRSVESSALQLLRAVEEDSQRRRGVSLEVRAPADVALYILNEKRAAIAALEEARDISIKVAAASGLMAPDFEIVSLGRHIDDEDEIAPREERPARAQERRGPRHHARQEESPIEVEEEVELDEEAEAEPIAQLDAGDGDEDGRRGRRRRRGRRGGRRRDEGEGSEPIATKSEPRAPRAESEERGDRGDRGGRRRRRRRGAGGRFVEVDGGALLDFLSSEPIGAPVIEVEPEPAPEPIAPPPPVAEPTAAIAEASREEENPEPALALAAAYPDDDPALDGAAAIPAEDPYEPDLERRQRFFARLNRWGKKA